MRCSACLIVVPVPRIPVGYNLLSIGGFIMLSIDGGFDMQFAQYMIVVVALGIGLSVFMFAVPDTPLKGGSSSLSQFKSSVLEYRQWVPLVAFNSIALLIDMFCVALFSAVSLYIWDMDEIPLWTGSSMKLSHNAFICIYNCCTAFGDIVSRRIAYYIKPIHPLWFVSLSAVGAVLCLSKIAILAFPGIMLVFAGNGFIYGSTTRRIDTYVLDKHHLVAMSFWLFVGDCGSFTGSNFVEEVKQRVGCAAGFLANSSGKCVPRVH